MTGSGNPSKMKKKSTDNAKSTKSSVKVNEDKSKSMLCKRFSVGNVDFVAKKIKKERLSDTGNSENNFPSTSGLFRSGMESSTVQNKNNNNSNEDHNVSSSNDFLDVSTDKNSAGMESEGLSDHTNLIKVILDSKECDTSTVIDENFDMSDDVKTPVCLNAPQNSGVIGQFFLVDTDKSDEINTTARSKLCEPPVRGSKKATSNFIRHMTVCEYHYFLFSYTKFP